MAAVRWTAVRSLLLVALLHRLNCLAFLAASSPVWLLAAFLLGVVLVHSEPNEELAAGRNCDDVSASASEEEDNNNNNNNNDYSSSSAGDDVSESTEVVKAAVAWTADDEHSIRSIGSLELERDTRLEKLMSRRTIHRDLIDLDVHIPAVHVLAPRKKNVNPFQDDEEGDLFPGSAPSSLLRNPFADDEGDPEDDIRRPMMRSLTTGGGPSRPASRFRPYFVAGDKEGGCCSHDMERSHSHSHSNSSSSSTSSSSSAGGNKAAVVAKAAARSDEEPSAPASDAQVKGTVVAVDVELISDSSDDDMSLPGYGDEEDAFEVESITRQVAAGNIINNPQQGDRETLPPPPPPVEEDETKREIRPAGEINSSAGAAQAAAAAAPAPSAAAPAPSAAAPEPPPPAAAAALPPVPVPAAAGTNTNSKKSKKVAVFGFLRK